MSDKDDEFDILLRNYRILSPEQRDLLTRRVIERARAHRAKGIRNGFRLLFRWIRRRAGWIRQRVAAARLHALDDRMLKDIGIHRSEIEAVVRPRNQTQPAPPCRTVQAPRERVGRAA